MPYIPNTAIFSDTVSWNDYTPTLTASVSDPTLGSGSTQIGRYMRIGTLVMGVARIAFGSSGVAAGSGNYIFSLPVAMDADWQNPNRIIGNGLVLDSGTTRRGAVMRSDLTVTTAQVLMSADDTAGPITNAVPWTWAANDFLEFIFMYEAA